MTGRAGTDAFIQNDPTDPPINANLADVITDFSSAQGGKINLRFIKADLTLTGHQALRFIEMDLFGHTCELRFDGNFLTGDLAGNAASDFGIMVSALFAPRTTDSIF